MANKIYQTVKNLANKDISEYIRFGVASEKYSKLGLACIKDFEKGISLVKDKDKMKSIIEDYKNKISKIRRKHRLSHWSVMGTTLILPYLLIGKFFNAESAFLYACGASLIQLADWTNKVLKMKGEDPDMAGRWHSYYPYENEFNKKVKSIEEVVRK